jgi:uncharacterized protein YaaR (DUF327 family)
MTALFVSLGLVVLFIGGWLAYIKWGGKNSAVINRAFDMAAMLSAVLSSLIKNNELKTDPHDVLVAISKIASTGSLIVSQASSGLDLAANKDNIKKFVTDVISQFPELKDKLNSDMVDKEIEASFMVLSLVKK